MFCRHFNKTVNSPLALPEREIFMANSTLLNCWLSICKMPSWDNSSQSKVAARKSKFIISTHVCSAGIAHGLIAACKLEIALYFSLFMNISLGASP